MFQPKITKYKVIGRINASVSMFVTLMFVQIHDELCVIFERRFKFLNGKENFVIKSFCEPEINGFTVYESGFQDILITKIRCFILHRTVGRRNISIQLKYFFSFIHRKIYILFLDARRDSIRFDSKRNTSE